MFPPRSHLELFLPKIIPYCDNLTCLLLKLVNRRSYRSYIDSVTYGEIRLVVYVGHCISEKGETGPLIQISDGDFARLFGVHSLYNKVRQLTLLMEAECTPHDTYSIIPNPLSASLTSLHLRAEGYCNILPILSLPNLSRLMLICPGLTRNDLHKIAQYLPQLSHLQLQMNVIYDRRSGQQLPFEALTNLISLRLHIDEHIVADSNVTIEVMDVPVVARNLTKLMDFELCSNRFVLNEEMRMIAEHLTCLTRLVLLRCDVSDFGVSKFSRLGQLQQLSLRGVGVSGGIALGDLGLQYLGLLTNITALDLRRSYHSSQGIYALKQLTKLRHLRIGIDTFDMDLQVKSITSTFSALQQLHVYGSSPLTTATVHLVSSQLPRLTQLSLVRCGVTAEGAQELSTCVGLRYLNLSHNPGITLHGWQFLTTLENLIQLIGPSEEMLDVEVLSQWPQSFVDAILFQPTMTNLKVTCTACETVTDLS